MVLWQKCVLVVSATVDAGTMPRDSNKDLWHEISVGDKCLFSDQTCDLSVAQRHTPTCDLENGVSVFLDDCSNNTKKRKWFVTSDWEIRAGNKYQQPDYDGFTVTTISGWCLDAPDHGENSRLTIWECNGSPQQHFDLEQQYDENLQYHGSVHLSGGKCLDVDSNSDEVFPAAAAPCTGVDNQKWNICTTKRITEITRTNRRGWPVYGGTCDLSYMLAYGTNVSANVSDPADPSQEVSV